MSWIGGLIAMPFLLIWWVIANLWPLVLVAAAVFVGLKVRKAWLGLVASSSTEVSPRSYQADASYRMRELAVIENFTEAVSRVQQNMTLSAHEKMSQLVKNYGRERARLQSAGRLSPDVDASLRSQVESAGHALIGQTSEFGTSLNALLRTYDGRSKLRRMLK